MIADPSNFHIILLSKERADTADTAGIPITIKDQEISERMES